MVDDGEYYDEVERSRNMHSHKRVASPPQQLLIDAKKSKSLRSSDDPQNV